MDAEERRRLEAVLAKISRDQKEVEADPAAAVRKSLAPAMVQAKRRLLWMLFWTAMAAALAIGFVLRRHYR